MKRFHTQTAAALFAILCCASFARAQDQPSEDQSSEDQPNRHANSYTYKAYDYPGASETAAYGISNSGEVVGYYSGDGCSQTDCAFTHLKGKYTSVECALENQTAFFDISHTTAEVVGGYAYYGGVHGFIWQGVDSCFDIVDPDGTSNTQAEGVNDKGTVVGFYVGSSGAYQAFMYTAKGVYTTISCFGAASRAYGINDSDEIVGDYLDSDGVYRGFLYKSGKCSTVKYPKSRATYARGINKSGQITGFYGDGNNVAHGFLKTGSAFTTIDYPEAATTFLFHLNDSGAIAGFYQATAGGPTTGMVATPKK